VMVDEIVQLSEENTLSSDSEPLSAWEQKSY